MPARANSRIAVGLVLIAGNHHTSCNSLPDPESLSTRKTSGKADCGAAVQRGSRTETARKLSEQGLTAFVWSR
jgi:hypothetical protein